MGLRGSTQQHLTPSIRGKQNGICGKIDAGGYCFQRSHSGVYRSPWCWKRLLKTWCVPFFFKGVSWLIWNSNARIFSLFRGLRTQVFLSNMQIRLYGTCLLRLVIIAQLPKALMHPDSEVDYRVAAGIAGSSAVGPMVFYPRRQEGNVWCYTSSRMPARMDWVKRISSTGRST